MPAAFVCVAGAPLIVRAVRTLLSSGAVGRVVLSVPDAEVARTREIFEAEPELARAMRVIGGADSLPLPDDVHTVVVHDVFRPLAPPEMAASVVGAAVAERMVVVPVLPVSDTIKVLGADGLVHATADRSALRVVQTPLAMPAERLRREGHRRLSGGVELVEQLGGPVLTVPGDPLAFEVRTPWDLELAELLAGGS